MKRGLLLFALVATALSAQDSASDAASKAEEIAKAAEIANNPLSFATTAQIQPTYTSLSDGAAQFQMVNRLVMPFKGVLFPGLGSTDPKEVFGLSRFQIPVVSQTAPESTNTSVNATGFGDSIFIDTVAFPHPWGTWGVGPALGLPTATNAALGSGKWTAGAAVLVIVTSVKGFVLGGLVQQFWSFAGDSNRKNVNQMLVQPIASMFLGKGYFLNFNPILVFDWENNTSSIPVNLGIGRAFSKSLTAFIQVETNVSGPAKNAFSVKTQINFIF